VGRVKVGSKKTRGKREFSAQSCAEEKREGVESRIRMGGKGPEQNRGVQKEASEGEVFFCNGGKRGGSGDRWDDSTGRIL